MNNNEYFDKMEFHETIMMKINVSYHSNDYDHNAKIGEDFLKGSEKVKLTMER